MTRVGGSWVRVTLLAIHTAVATGGTRGVGARTLHPAWCNCLWLLYDSVVPRRRPLQSGGARPSKTPTPRGGGTPRRRRPNGRFTPPAAAARENDRKGEKRGGDPYGARATPKAAAITRGRRRVGGKRAPRAHGQGGASAWVYAWGEPPASPRGKEHAPQREGARWFVGGCGWFLWVGSCVGRGLTGWGSFL